MTTVDEREAVIANLVIELDAILDDDARCSCGVGATHISHHDNGCPTLLCTKHAEDTHVIVAMCKRDGKRLVCHRCGARNVDPAACTILPV